MLKLFPAQTYRRSIDHLYGVLEHAKYAVDENSPQWREYIAATPKEFRVAEVVRRRISRSFAELQRKDSCNYCWLHKESCICGDLGRLSAASQLKESPPSVLPILVLHSREFGRQTNTGHVVSMLLDCPVLVWGIPEHDAVIKQIGDATAQCVQCAGRGCKACPALMLYPKEGAIDLCELEFGYNTGVPEEAPPKPSDVRETAQLLLVADSTWPEAYRVNRHVPENVPRVIIDIPSSYTTLFAPLRKQTRSSGVSTLEAICMAYSHGGMATEAATLTDAMKYFVAVVARDKNVYAGESPATELIYERFVKAQVSRQKRFTEVRDDSDVELPPPVLRHCLLCNKRTGWAQMPEHCRGRVHQEKVREAQVAKLGQERDQRDSEQT